MCRGFLCLMDLLQQFLRFGGLLLLQLLGLHPAECSMVEHWLRYSQDQRLKLQSEVSSKPLKHNFQCNWLTGATS